MLCAGNILPAGQEGVQVPDQEPGSGSSPGSRPSPRQKEAEAETEADIRIQDAGSALDDSNNNNNSTSTAKRSHRIYRAVHVDDSNNNYKLVQILINLRRLGHQIKPAKSWLPLLERMLIEGFALSRH